MNAPFGPAAKLNLTARLAQQIRVLIRQGGLAPGERLPAIMEMARRFRVGHPAVREALKSLEAMGVVEIRHGSGVYVSRADEVFLIAGPRQSTTFTKKLLLDLLRTREPLEVASTVLAATHATPEHLASLRRLLTTARQHSGGGDVPDRANLAFHRQIAIASDNAVLLQTLDVLRELFTDQQRMLRGILPSPESEHQEHLGILEALERRDPALGATRMRAHLLGELDAVTRWDPERQPVG